MLKRIKALFKKINSLRTIKGWKLSLIVKPPWGGVPENKTFFHYEDDIKKEEK
jgi:hypothetical protein